MTIELYSEEYNQQVEIARKSTESRLKRKDINKGISAFNESIRKRNDIVKAKNKAIQKENLRRNVRTRENRIPLRQRSGLTYRDNKRIREINKAVERDNKKRNEGSLELLIAEKTKPYVPPPKFIREFIRKEKEVTDALKARSQTDWLEAMKVIRGNNLRRQIACIIWWDFLSEKQSDKFDPYTYKTISDKITSDEIKRALLAIGYTPAKAENRVVSMNSSYRYIKKADRIKNEQKKETCHST